MQSMTVLECLDKNKQNNISSLHSYTLEETELLESVSKLLYKTKSVRDTISIIDKEINNPFNDFNNKKIKNDIIFSFSFGNVNTKDGTMYDDNLNIKETQLLKESKHEQIPYSGC